MRRIKFKGEKLNDLVGYLYTAYGESPTTRANTIITINGRKIGFFVFEKYYARNMRTTSCSILYFQHDQDTCEILVVGAAGSGGLFDIDWWSKSSIESMTRKDIIRYAVENLKLKKIEDIEIKVEGAYRSDRTYPHFHIR